MAFGWKKISLKINPHTPVETRKTYSKVWLSGWDQEHNERCPSNFTKHCDGWVFYDTRVAKKISGRQTRARCAKMCGDKIQYAPGKTGSPCDLAIHQRLINPSENIQGDAKGAFECTWVAPTDKTLVPMSKVPKYVNSGVYEQLLFGKRIGGYNTEGKGYCEDANNLHKEVGGGTCYDKLAAKVSQATLKQSTVKYCEKNRTDPKCKCINVSGNTFLADCRRNPTWAGCKEILDGEADFKKLGLTSASGLYGNADCLSPGICSGDVYSPLTNVPACSNKNAVCNQILQQDNIKAYAGINSAQHCNIDFEAEQNKKDVAKVTKSTTSQSTTPPAAADNSGQQIAAGKGQQIAALGGGVASLTSLCCLLIIIIILLLK